MKKYLLSIMIIFISLTSIAQKTQDHINTDPQINWDDLYNHYFPAKIDDFLVNIWVNYPLYRDSLNGKTATINANYLFPDSAKVAFSNTSGLQYKDVEVHNIGNVLDMKPDEVFSLIWGYMNVSWCDEYTVDSIAIMYLYNRLIPDTSIVDTLIVTLYNDTLNNLPIKYLTDSNIVNNYDVDTLLYLSQKYDYLTNSSLAAEKQVIKVPLTNEDTAITQYKIKSFSTDVGNPWSFCNGFRVPNNSESDTSGFAAVSITFKPGYNYAPGDTINLNKNYFMFASYEEFGASTYPTYIDTSNFWPWCNNKQFHEWNLSSTVSTDIRYNQSASWNGFFKPTYAFDSTYKYEHHMIFYNVCRGEFASVDEVVNKFDKLNIYPNPVNKELINLEFELNQSEEIEISIFDNFGKIIKEIHNIPSGFGKHILAIDISALPSGLYLCKLKSDSGHAVAKFSVVK